MVVKTMSQSVRYGVEYQHVDDPLRRHLGNFELLETVFGVSRFWQMEEARQRARKMPSTLLRAPDFWVDSNEQDTSVRFIDHPEPDPSMDW